MRLIYKNKAILLCCIACFFLFTKCKKEEVEQAPSPVGKWTSLDHFPGTPQYLAASFAIGKKGYVINGFTFPRNSDWYIFDSEDLSWETKTNAPMNHRFAMGFSFGEYGYLLTGMDTMGFSTNDFWKYDVNQDKWEQLNPFPGIARHNAVVLTLGEKAYFGIGWNNHTDGTQTQLKDWWEYNPQNDTWTQKATYPGGPSAIASGIGVGGNGYVGLAGPGPSPGTQWWQYNPVLDDWKRKASLPGKARYGAGIFAIGDKIIAGGGLTGLGYDEENLMFDWWHYDTSTDQWSVADSLDFPVSFGTGFVFDNTAYFGVGYDERIGGPIPNWWKFEIE